MSLINHRDIYYAQEIPSKQHTKKHNTVKRMLKNGLTSNKGKNVQKWYNCKLETYVSVSVTIIHIHILSVTWRNVLGSTNFVTLYSLK